MKTKQAAMIAARKVLGKASVEGVDFVTRNTGAGWVWEEVPAANEPAAKAKAKRAPKPETYKIAAKGRGTGKATKTRAKPSTTPGAAPMTKGAVIEALLRHPGGANSKELEAATGWKAPSVRGYLGTLRTRGRNVTAEKLPGKATVYRLVDAVADPGDVV